MIEAYTLESLLKKYGIDATKVINKNNNILEYGEYQDIDKTLNYLVKELHINARNIEKCPSIMYKAVNNIKENYEFLITTKINTGNIETTLHILNTNPKNLKETYNLPPQGNYVYGRVIEKLSNEPMVGVTIRLDGHSTGVITDINGCYVLTLPEKGGLVIYSYIGFETRKIKVTSRQKVDVHSGSDCNRL